MLFNSYQFIIFFPIVTALYFILPHRMRLFMLLAASCFFYMVLIPVYILILFTLIIIDYFAAIWIEKTQTKNRKLFLLISIISTCLALVIFKYFNFFNSNIAAIAHFLNLKYPVSALGLILPIGLSFHTFQSLSYVIEVYKNNQIAERNFLVYSLYVMFYPQLVAGPIERPQNLLRQFYEKHVFEYSRVSSGLKLMLWGMFKKVVIADRLAAFVSTVYDAPHDFQGVSLIIATVFFAFQIYCDFSGYSDIAIGAAQVMGFRLMDNFNRPYFSKTISEFWKRWHISLSSWFRDYLYIPLGGSRVSVPRWCYSIFITFLISGLWHGANWTYIVWGLLNGIYLIFGRITWNLRNAIIGFVGLSRSAKGYRYIQVLLTFTMVCFGWIFFRAKNIGDAFYIAGHLFSAVPDYFTNLIQNIRYLGTGRSILQPILLGQTIEEFFIAVCSIMFLLFIHLIQRHGSIRHMLSTYPVWLRWACYCFMSIGIVMFGYFDSPKQFIYFQF